METHEHMLSEHFSVEESVIKFVEHEAADDRPAWCEVFVNEYRVGTGNSRESTTRDAIKNGKYALAKAERRLNGTS